MPRATTSMTIIITILIEVCIILVGAALITNVLSLYVPPLYLSLLITFCGVLVLCTSWLSHVPAGLALVTCGAYATLRSVDAISQPWLQYGLGVTLILLGTALILFQAIGGAVADQHAHIRQQTKK